MKAIRVHEFGGPEVLRYEDVPDPLAGSGEVVVQIRGVGVNPVETYIRAGTYALKPALPYIPGKDGAGVIEAVGEGVSRVKAGDRVYLAGTISGSYAEKALCRETQVFPLPDHLSYVQGAAVNVPYSAAFRALFQKAAALPGETVLIHGASGGVGIAAVQLARAAGMTVIGTAGTEEGKKLVAAEGAHHVLDHTSDGYLDAIPSITNGKGPGVILEMLANVNLAKDLGILARGGRIVVVGNRGTVEINPRDLMSRDAAVFGMVLMNATEEEYARIHAALGAGLAQGTLRPVVGRELPLSDAARAHRDIMGTRAYGKIVLIP